MNQSAVTVFRFKQKQCSSTSLAAYRQQRRFKKPIGPSGLSQSLRRKISFRLWIRA